MPNLTYKKIYGAFRASDPTAREGLYFTDDTNIIFAAGANLVTFESESRTQTVIPRAAEDNGQFQVTSISSDRRWLSVGAKGPQHCSLVVYDLTIGRKRRSLTIQPEVKSCVSVHI